MKSNRPQILLTMVFLLKDKGYFTEKDITNHAECSRSSFFRALSDFRCFLQESRPWETLVYNEAKKTYYLAPEKK